MSDLVYSCGGRGEMAALLRWVGPRKAYRSPEGHTQVWTKEEERRGVAAPCSRVLVVLVNQPIDVACELGSFYDQPCQEVMNQR